jgi:2-polyprenyl-3-methyl-5-hydroxy-6-metoxy-1,4-benzoquinol methylase
MKDSQAYYNSIANVYDQQSKRRIDYLNAVDTIVITECKNKGYKSYLDIGAGNGRRSLKIAKELRITDTTLIDNSIKMLHDLSSFEDVIALDVSIFDFDTAKKFDLITCLWNVVGHFPSQELMKRFFIKISSLLSVEGMFIFDVNNRYNISHYGTNSVMKNLQRDHNNDDNSGWFMLGDDINKTKVYIHSPFDLEGYILDTNLKQEAVYYLDYESGILKDTFFEGQLLYKIKCNLV